LEELYEFKFDYRFDYCSMLELKNYFCFLIFDKSNLGT